MKIKDIRWPIYGIGHHLSLKETNKVLYLEIHHDEFLIVDNKNLYGDTLGKRRLRLEPEDRYVLRKIHYSMYDVFNSKYDCFIDSNGIVVQFQKKHRRKLFYRKVVGTKFYDSGLLCKCEGIFKPIDIPFIPKITPKYLGLLVIDGDYHLYDLSQDKNKDSWRKW